MRICNIIKSIWPTKQKFYVCANIFKQIVLAKETLGQKKLCYRELIPKPEGVFWLLI